MRMLMLASLALLAACAHDKPLVVHQPGQVIEKAVPTYVRIDPKLTQRCTWKKDGQPSEVFEVARGRRTCLERYESQLDAIERVEGKPVP